MILTKHKLQKIIILCITCILLGLFASKLSISAKTELPYYIKVNKQQNCVTIYEKDKNGKYTIPIKAMICSTGVDTPLGTYKTPIKYRWKLLMGDVWGQYSTRVVGGILFHSVWYYKMDQTTLSATQYNKLGTAASHGCIRLTVEDAKWIYDNCPIGTTVEIYNDKDPGPLGKPEAIKLTTGTGWDPTDPSKNNPFNGKSPAITGAANKTIDWGTTFDTLKGVKASSTTGTDITNKLKAEGKVEVYTAGKYKIKYTVTDALGRVAEKTITVTVKKSVENPVIKGVKDQVIGSNTTVDRAFALKGVTAYLSTKKLSNKDIKVNIIKESDNVYTLEYTLTAANKKSTKEVATINVDTTPPVIEGIYYKEITKKQLEAGKEEIIKIALKGIKVKDDFAKLSTDKIKVTVKAKENYAYLVTYELADTVGNVTSEMVQFTYFSDTKLNGVMNHWDIPYGTEISKDYVMQGIVAINSNNEECTQLVTVKITTNDDTLYKVTYSVPNENGTIFNITSYYELGEKPENYVPKVPIEVETDETESSEMENTKE